VSERTAVYRLYGANDELLYIGISVNPDQRFMQHAASKEWWPEVARREVAMWFDDRPQAAAAEARAIRDHHPRHNLHIPDPDGTFGTLAQRVRHSAIRRTGRKGNPRHAFRFEPGRWASFFAAVKRDPLGRNATEVVHDLVGWYAREKPGDPVRPPKPPAVRGGMD